MLRPYAGVETKSCAECGKPFTQNLHARHVLTCSAVCAMARKTRMARERYMREVQAKREKQP